MFTKPPVTHCQALAVRNVRHRMETLRADGAPCVDVTAGQEEYKCDFLEAVAKETVQATAAMAPNPRATWTRPDEIAAGGAPRIDATRIDAFDEETRLQAERDMARLRQRHRGEHAEGHRVLRINGGILLTELVDNLIPPWNRVRIQDPRDQGPPATRRRRPLAFTYNPDLGQVQTQSNRPGVATPAQITEPPPPRYLLQASPPPPEPEQRYIGIPPWLPTFQRRERPMHNHPLPPSAEHYMQLEHP